MLASGSDAGRAAPAVGDLTQGVFFQNSPTPVTHCALARPPAVYVCLYVLTLSMRASHIAAAADHMRRARCPRLAAAAGTRGASLNGRARSPGSARRAGEIRRPD